MSAIPPLGPTRLNPREERVDSWSSYWKGGALHSCAGSFEGNYAGPLRRFWEELFAELPESARVLDACCGNAPLSQLLIAHPRFEAATLRIDAVDLARVDPPWLAQLGDAARARMTVHSRIDVARLPFDAGSFALCMSQFGIEYADAAAIAELARVTAVGGTLAALVHHVDSLPVRIAREELEHADWLAEQALDERVQALIPPMARSATAEGQAALRGDAEANDQRARFNGSLQRLQERVSAARYPDLLQETADALMAVLQRARLAGEAAAEAALENWRTAHRHSLLRQRELIAHARDEPQLREWLAAFPSEQARIATMSFPNGELAGWAVRLRRAG